MTVRRDPFAELESAGYELVNMGPPLSHCAACGDPMAEVLGLSAPARRSPSSRGRRGDRSRRRARTRPLRDQDASR